LHEGTVAVDNLGLIARLSSETQLHHPDADAELERLLAEPSAQAYRAWLVRQYGFLAPLETALENTPRLADLVDLRARRKLPRLRSDLLALGMSDSAITGTPTFTAIPTTFTRTPIALGWLYAVERSILHYNNAFRQLARALPGEVAFASSYLKCYESNVGVMWRGFSAALDAACTRSEDAADVVVGAQEAFRCLRRWQQHHTDALPRVGFLHQRPR
jgi:heme oxygenase (biliverdin-IX-beta and delta-forming)